MKNLKFTEKYDEDYKCNVLSAASANVPDPEAGFQIVEYLLIKRAGRIDVAHRAAVFTEAEGGDGDALNPEFDKNICLEQIVSYPDDTTGFKCAERLCNFWENNRKDRAIIDASTNFILVQNPDSPEKVTKIRKSCELYRLGSGRPVKAEFIYNIREETDAAGEKSFTVQAQIPDVVGPLPPVKEASFNAVESKCVRHYLAFYMNNVNKEQERVRNLAKEN